METKDKIAAMQQKVNRLERQYAQAQLKARKQETRLKIELGGLVVKSGMNQYPKSVIFGALLDAAQHIENDWQQYQLFEEKGKLGFLKK